MPEAPTAVARLEQRPREVVARLTALEDIVGVLPLGPTVLTTGAAQAKTGVLTAPLSDNGGQVFNVKASGAILDGVADDTAAFAAALTAASAVSGSTVYIPRGTLLLTTNPTFPSSTRVQGAGQGNTTIKLANGSNAPVFNIGNRTDVGIADLTIDGNGANQTSSGYGIQVDAGISRLTVERVRFLNCRLRAVSLGGTIVDARFIDCTFDGITVASSGSYLAIAQQQTQFRGCSFRNGPNVSLQVGDDCQVVGCRFEAASSTQHQAILTGVSTSNGDRVLIDGNTFSWAAAGDASDTNMTIQTAAAASDIRITNNTLQCGGAVGGIFVAASTTASASRCVVANNTITNPHGDGILIGLASANTTTGIDNVVIGNTITGGTANGPAMGVGIEVQCDRTLVIGNTVKGAPGAGIWIGGKDSLVVGNICTSCATGSATAGIKVARSGVVVSGNTCLDNGDPANVFGGFGILVTTDTIRAENTTAVFVHGNRCSDTRAGGARVQDYGVYLTDNTTTVGGVTVSGNDLSNNVSAGYNAAGASGGTIVAWGNKGGTPSLAVTGSRGANAALASALTQLAALGLITDSSTA